MKKIIVSACLLGRNCKYSGGNNRNEAVLSYVKGREVIPVCPEVAAGMPAPRPPVELREGRVISCEGKDLDAVYRAGVARTLESLAGKRSSVRSSRRKVLLAGSMRSMTAHSAGKRSRAKGSLRRHCGRRACV